tara:strand:- start:153238 stop:155385 length:2148 start_codon:yes stop_codon:yes gene_type:complete
MKILRIFLLLISVILVHSCGDEPLSDQGVMDLSDIQQICAIDAKRLEKILDEDVSRDIRCLNENLNQFVTFVRRADERYIHINELKRFVDRFFAADVAQKTNDLLKFVYMLNEILLKDPKNNLSVANIPLLFDIFAVVNTHGSLIKSSFTKFSDDNAKYWNNRENLNQAVSNASSALLSVITQRASLGKSLDIIFFLEELKTILGLDDDQMDIPLIDSYLFLKKLILGGEKRVITDKELEVLFANLGGMVTLGLDALYVKHKDFKIADDENYFYLDLIKEAQTYFHNHENNVYIFEFKDLSDLIERVLDNDWEIDNFEESIANLKIRLIGGERNKYTFSDVKVLFGWGQEVFEMLYFNDVTFSHYKSKMESPKVIETIRRPDLEEYKIFTKDRQKELWNQFELITLHYRYFQDDEGYLHYYREFKRFKKGFNFTALLRYALKKIVDEYGHVPEGERRKHVSKENVAVAIKEVEGAAREIGLWPKDFDRFVREAVDGSDVFQYQGDGNGYSNVEELTEYVSAILSANKHASSVHEKLKNYCTPIGDDENIELNCYREYFWHIFFNELGNQKYFSKLYEYVQSVGMEEAQQYLLNMEKYAREFPDESLPLTKVDLNRLMVAFSNVEAIYILYDYNNDGWLDRRELDIAYFRFETVIIKVGELEPKTYKYGHSIFLYLIKKMEIPSVIQMAIFHYLTPKKKIKGTRFNIASILAFFIE